jgi:hypothetical protein
MSTLKRIVTGSLLALGAASFAATAGAQMSYNYNTLPRQGQASFPAWPFYYWSYFNGCNENNGVGGGLAWRWAGSSSKSPAEKFDAAFGYASKYETAKLASWANCAYSAKKACVGGSRVDQACLKKSEVRNAHAACKQEFTIDSATEHEVARQGCGVLDADKWWGICHGAAPAGVLWKEPQKAVTYNGVEFQAKDIQGLLSAVATSTELDPNGWAGCRNDGEYTRTSTRCPTKEYAASDVTPREYHAFLGYFIGQRGKGIVADVSTGPEVWNQSQDQYQTECAAGGDASVCSGGGQAYTCKTWFRYANDMWTTETAGNSGDPRFYTKRNLNYTLCVKDGLIAGNGKWNHDPNTDKDALQPDFLWAPIGLGDPYDASNPYIFGKKTEIVDNLAKPSAGTGTAPTPTGEKEVKKTVGAAIPDNNATGVSSSVLVSGTGTFKSLSLCLDITHTYRGDLLITASYAGKVWTAWRNEGGSADDVKTCLSTTSYNGLALGKRFYVKVKDTAADDVGKFNSFSVRYTK